MIEMEVCKSRSSSNWFLQIFIEFSKKSVDHLDKVCFYFTSVIRKSKRKYKLSPWISFHSLREKENKRKQHKKKRWKESISQSKRWEWAIKKFNELEKLMLNYQTKGFSVWSFIFATTAFVLSLSEKQRLFQIVSVILARSALSIYDNCRTSDCSINFSQATKQLIKWNKKKKCWQWLSTWRKNFSVNNLNLNFFFSFECIGGTRN